MKIGFSLKLILLILSILTFGIFVIGIYVIHVIQNKSFEYSMLISYGLAGAGFLSVIYQVKTLRFYKKTPEVINLEKNVFWLGNIIFAVTLIVFSIYLLFIRYEIYSQMQFDSQYVLPFIIITFFLTLGVFLIAEVGFLYRKIQYLQQQNKIESIDDIKGFSEDEDVDV